MFPATDARTLFSLMHGTQARASLQHKCKTVIRRQRSRRNGLLSGLDMSTDNFVSYLLHSSRPVHDHASRAKRAGNTRFEKRQLNAQVLTGVVSRARARQPASTVGNTPVCEKHVLQRLQEQTFFWVFLCVCVVFFCDASIGHARWSFLRRLETHKYDKTRQAPSFRCNNQIIAGSVGKTLSPSSSKTLILTIKHEPELVVCV